MMKTTEIPGTIMLGTEKNPRISGVEFDIESYNFSHHRVISDKGVLRTPGPIIVLVHDHTFVSTSA